MQNIRRPLVFIFLILFSLQSSTLPVQADAGPKEGFFETAAGIIVISQVVFWGVFGLVRHFKKEKRARAVTAIHFDWERVRLTIGQERMEVTAEFEYTNQSDERLVMNMFFPFTQKVRGNIKDIQINLDRIDQHGVVTAKRIKYHIKRNRIDFRYYIDPREKIRLSISYDEALQGSQAAYILTSIKRWKRPVGLAEFIVELPLELQNPHFSYNDSLVESIHDQKRGVGIYRFEMHDLFPDQEFEVSW
ncbi:MAG: hypothetical protein KJ950_09755 [Proteobacteria bacterium]|nr:hypothetical protein [Pseudomonadota bacterium]MBU1688939.1 hypothetical protein [Pseudomonadota bacterium]